eukprot:UN34807
MVEYPEIPSGSSKIVLCPEVGDVTVACIDGNIVVSGRCYIDSVLIDNNQKQQINEWIGEENTWSLCYRKSIHTETSEIMHKNCDNTGATVTIVHLSTGKLIGGYAPPNTWNSCGCYINRSEAFLFSLTNNFKHEIYQNHGNAIYSHSGYGPTWGGGHDFHISGGNNLDGGYCALGHTYRCRLGTTGSSECRNDFCGSYNTWKVLNFEVFTVYYEVVTPEYKLQINEWMGGDRDYVWEKCYQRTINVKNSQTMHSMCDYKGATISVIKMDNGLIVGGYSPPNTWNSCACYISREGGFLFSLTTGYKYNQKRTSNAFYSHNEYGPTWGDGHDIHVNNGLTGGYCNLGNAYDCRVGVQGSAECRNDICGTYDGWKVDELEVFVISYEIITVAQKEQINNWIGDSNLEWELCFRRSDWPHNSETMHRECDQ